MQVPSKVIRLLFLLSFMMLHSISSAKETPHVLFIAIDDLRPELGCYGVDYIQSRTFSRHYVQAPSCGPSRYTLLTGK